LTHHIAVIGGGPAGIEAALAAARAGVRVTLVAEEALGGRANWHSLLPSKVWLAAAAQHQLVPVDPPAVLERIRRTAVRWNTQQAEALQALRVTVLEGRAAFASAHALTVTGSDTQESQLLEADTIIIAGGSVPRFPPELRPDGKRVIAPRFAGKLTTLPTDAVVVGGGATGCEFVYLFNRLGVQVTWVVGPEGVLPGMAPAAGQSLAATLAGRGVDLRMGQVATGIERAEDAVSVVTAGGEQYRAALAFLAIGRRPDLSRLALAAAGLPDTGRLSVDEYLRTSVPTIYAVGDAAGAPMIANRALAQARIAARHASGATVAPFREDTVIHAVYSDPEVAQVGQLIGPGLRNVRIPFATGLKAHLADEAELATGFFELAYDGATMRVAGGLAYGAHAADALAPVAFAIQMGACVDDLAASYAAYPTISELAGLAARKAIG
jgi:pyruvate/2-oxoglutarate dehydrogenase complex dihydrolipoamide dehydrogenase (E3) component